MFTTGGHSTFAFSKKAQVITANGACLHLYCAGNHHVLTIGFQRETVSGKKEGEGVIEMERSMHRGNNVFMKSSGQ